MIPVSWHRAGVSLEVSVIARQIKPYNTCVKENPSNAKSYILRWCCRHGAQKGSDAKGALRLLVTTLPKSGN
jgi:hypothetical protein